MKRTIEQSLLLAVLLLPMLFSITQATEPDTIWTRNFWRELNASLPRYFEFHPTNDSIFIFTSFGKDSNGIDTDEMTVHFVNTITGQVFQKYAPIHKAHYTPDGKFLIGHNDSTLAYISLDSMKPVRNYPILPHGLGNFTIDEKGKYVYTTGYTDTNKNLGFFRWCIDSATVKQIDLPDSLLKKTGCPINWISINEMFVSDTAKIMLMQLTIDRPYPYCNRETRVWGIDLNADTVKYDFTKLYPTSTSSFLDKILPKRTQFIGSGWKYENQNEIRFYSVFDVATGAKIKDMLKGSYDDYAISKDESFIITSDIVVYPNIQLNVFKFANYDTVYIYNDVYTGPLVISPNNEFILQGASIWFILYSTPWYPTSVIKPKDETPETIIYPNPASDYIEISYPPRPPGEGWGEGISIFDLLGTEMQSTPVSSADTPADGGQVRIDVSGLQPGVYFVRVVDVVRKFVKM